MVLVKLLTAVVTVISFTSTPFGQAEVRSFKSPLDATGRRYACPSESLSFTCEVNGQFIQWTVNSLYRTIFFNDDIVNAVDVVTVNTDHYDVRAILTRNDILNTHSRNLMSTLILDSPPSLLVNPGPQNISCTSDTDTHGNVKVIRMAEAPNMPRNVVVSRVPEQDSVEQQKCATSNVTLAIEWEEPDNIERFDLVHYKINALVFDVESGSLYNLNGTSIQPEYHINVPYSSSVNISISAVSKCSQQVGIKSNVYSVEHGTAASRKDVATKTGFEAYFNAINGCKQNLMKPWQGLMIFLFLGVL